MKIPRQEAANQKGEPPLVASRSHGQVSTRNGHETRLNVTVIVPPNHVMSVQIDHHSQKMFYLTGAHVRVKFNRPVPRVTND